MRVRDDDDDNETKGAALPSEAPSGPRDRLSGTALVDSAQVASARVAKVTRSSMPPSPIDRLFVALASLPVDKGRGAVLRAAIDALALLLPAYGVGVRYVDREGDTPRVLRAGVTAERNPSIPEAMAAVVDGAPRVFPTFANERAIEFVEDGYGAPSPVALHVAGDDAGLDDDTSPPMLLVMRAAITLTSALAHARAHADAAEARASVHELTRRMAQADKLATFGQLAAGILHDLNNPLTSILAYTDVLLRKHALRASRDNGDPRDDGEDTERLRRIHASANRLIDLTRDLVSYTRPSSGEVRIPVDVHKSIDQAILFCEHELVHARARIERHYGPPAIVLGAPPQLVQIFVNLVTNACHAMPDGGGAVTVTTSVAPGPVHAGEAPGSFVRIVVEDTGHGIPAEIIPRIFAAFFTTKGEGRGTGLGLSIVRSLVEAHGGDIYVERTGVSASAPSEAGSRVGARFVVSFPLHPSRPV